MKTTQLIIIGLALIGCASGCTYHEGINPAFIAKGSPATTESQPVYDFEKIKALYDEKIKLLEDEIVRLKESDATESQAVIDGLNKRIQDIGDLLEALESPADPVVPTYTDGGGPIPYDDAGSRADPSTE